MGQGRGMGRLPGAALLPAQTRPALTQGMGGKSGSAAPGPGVGRGEGRGWGLSVACAVRVCRDAGWLHGTGADAAVQSLARAAGSLQSPIHPFLKLAPEDEERRKQPGGAKLSRVQPVPCLLRSRLLLQYLAPLAHRA